MILHSGVLKGSRPKLISTERVGNGSRAGPWDSTGSQQAALQRKAFTLIGRAQAAVG